MLALISNSQIPASAPSSTDSNLGTQSLAPASSVSQSVEHSDTSSTSSVAATADTVKISNAGQQALQEYRETSVQTAQEAARGDLQAKHLLAKEEAARAASLGG